jgi:Flp pilus assembly protein TadD
LARSIGDVYLRLELFSAAERWYRRAVQLGAEVFEPLAAALAKQGRTQEAVALCLETAKHDQSLRPALTLASVLGSTGAKPRDYQTAEPYLKKIADAHKDQPELLNCMASIRLLQDRSTEAIELYRQVLRLRPKDFMVINNLATLLSEQPEPERRNEALEYIDQAIDLVGPQPGFLDTKGMALLYSDKAEQAMKLLQTACDSPNPDPRFRFHLAVAYSRLDQLDKARASLHKAREGNLEQLVLTAKDRQLLADLDKQLGQ